ncbi:hypothetical protein BZA77DRAFT_355108 [Pyronema omphalodes]|nr:hypothetical protein BZA77DRAFT_355108 [Pyronema omphalodes]
MSSTPSSFSYESPAIYSHHGSQQFHQDTSSLSTDIDLPIYHPISNRFLPHELPGLDTSSFSLPSISEASEASETDEEEEEGSEKGQDLELPGYEPHLRSKRYAIYVPRSSSDTQSSTSSEPGICTLDQSIPRSIPVRPVFIRRQAEYNVSSFISTSSSSSSEDYEEDEQEQEDRDGDNDSDYNYNFAESESEIEAEIEIEIEFPNHRNTPEKAQHRNYRHDKDTYRDAGSISTPSETSQTRYYEDSDTEDASDYEALTHGTEVAPLVIPAKNRRLSGSTVAPVVVPRFLRVEGSGVYMEDSEDAKAAKSAKSAKLAKLAKSSKSGEQTSPNPSYSTTSSATPTLPAQPQIHDLLGRTLPPQLGHKLPGNILDEYHTFHQKLERHLQENFPKHEITGQISSVDYRREAVEFIDVAEVTTAVKKSRLGWVWGRGKGMEKEKEKDAVRSEKKGLW